MSLSPWDLTGNVSFNIAHLYRPRRPSYVFATQTTRQRSGSYQHATGSIEAEEEEMVATTEADFIDNLVRRKQKQRSLSVHHQHSNLQEQHQYFSHQQLTHPQQLPNKSSELQLRIHFAKAAEPSDKPPIKSASMGNSFLPDASTPLVRHQASDFSIENPVSDSKTCHKDMKLTLSNNRCFSPRDLTPLVPQNRSATPDSLSSLSKPSINQPLTSRSLSFSQKNSIVNSRQGTSSSKCTPEQQTLSRLESDDEKDHKRHAITRQNSLQEDDSGRRHPTVSSLTIRRSKWRYTKNLVVLSLGFILVFTAFRSVQNLQSSINTEGRLGVFAMSLVHVTTFISCLFAPILVEKLSSKWTIVIGLMFYLFWIAANFFPHVSTLFPTSIGVGFGQSLAWGAQVSYIERLAVDYAHLSKELTQQELYKFNGIFLACFQSSHIWGNLVSSLMITDDDLAQKSSYHHYFLSDENNTDPFEMDDVIYPGSDFEQRSCGVYDICTDKSLADLWSSSKRPVEPATKNILKLMASYLVFASVGFLLIFFLLEKVNSKNTSEKTYPQGILNNLRHLSCHKTYRFLIPLLIFNGFEQGFVYSDYTKSYIRCTVGVQYIGYNMITLGMTNSIFSIGLGVISRHIAREAIVGIGCVLHLGILVFLLVWIPGPNLVPVFFVISALWGLCDAIWQTQCNCLVNLSCPNDHDVAFQVFRMLQGLGATMAFLLSGLTCVSSKLYVLICLLVLAIISYVFVENNLRRPQCVQSSTIPNQRSTTTNAMPTPHRQETKITT